MNSRPADDTPGAPSRARLLVPVLGGGLVAALFVAIVPRVSPAQSVDQVAGSIRELALARNETLGLEAGGTIGPWHISASSVDAGTGIFNDFKLACGPTRIAARTARLMIDAEHDTFSFELKNAIYTRLPSPTDAEEDQSLVTLDEYVLGPAPYGVDIVHE